MYKNWKAICAVPDTHFRWALALLDLASEFGKLVVARLPDFFTENEQVGPVPLSVMRMRAEENAAAEGSPGNGSVHLHCYDAIPNWMPKLWFVTSYRLKEYPEAQPVPPELESVAVVGTICQWEGKKIILVDYIGDEEWFFVPAECIFIDPIPLSALMNAAEQYSREDQGLGHEEEDRHFTLQFAANQSSLFMVPVAFAWEHDREPPAEVVWQLVGQKAQAGLTVTYRDKQYIVLNIEFAGDLPQIGSIFTEPPQVQSLALAEARYVALDK